MLKLRVFDFYEKVQFYITGPFFRSLGKRVANAGLALQGDLANDDRIVPSLRCRKYQNYIPNLGQANFIAPNSTIIGDVQVGEQSSVWYGAIIRGDIGKVQIGNNSLVQDLVVVNPNNKEKPSKIGNNVLVGPNSVLESCELKDNSFVGMGSTLRQGVILDSYGVVAAGAVISENTYIQANQVYAGNPAIYLRDLTPDEREAIAEHHQEQIELARIHSEETEKSFREIINDQDNAELKDFMDEEELALRQLKNLGFPVEMDDEDFIEQRVFMKERPYPKESDLWRKNYDPYEQDLFKFPDNFKQYGENFEKYEEVKKFFENNPNGQMQSADKERVKPRNDDAWNKKYNL